MALTANRELNRYVDQELRSFPVAPATHIYKGAFVGIERATGYVRGLQRGDLFVGVAYEEVANDAGAGADAAIRVYTQGDFVMPVAAATVTMAGGPVYAIDDAETTAEPAPGASLVGVLLAMSSADIGIVRIKPMASSCVEHVCTMPLVSSASAPTLHILLAPERAVFILSARVLFATAPDQGAIDIGETMGDPDELVDAFDLSSLVAGVPTALPLLTPFVGPGECLFAKVGQASSSPGVGGVLSLRYVELP